MGERLDSIEIVLRWVVWLAMTPLRAGGGMVVCLVVVFIALVRLMFFQKILHPDLYLDVMVNTWKWVFMKNHELSDW